jgi:hypothetical protein
LLGLRRVALVRRRLIVVVTVAVFIGAGSATAGGVVWSAPVALQSNAMLSDSAVAAAAGQTVVGWRAIRVCGPMF